MYTYTVYVNKLISRGYLARPSWVSFSQQWFWDVLDIEKLWSYWPHGGYLLPASRWQHCLTPVCNIHFIAAFVGFNVWHLKTLSIF